jgi:hypothetical protein
VLDVIENKVGWVAAKTGAVPTANNIAKAKPKACGL